MCDTQVGLEGIVLSGTHYEPKSDVSGTGGGLFIQIDQRWPAVELHLEGIPSVATAKVDSAFGPVTASIGMFAATARFRVDRPGRFWAGIGTEVLAQQTPLQGLSRVDASRLAGSRFEIVGRFPLSRNHEIETMVGAMPHLSGIVYETVTFPNQSQLVLFSPETASMMDLSVAYGIRHNRSEFLVGVRAINFAAKFPSGREADRNVGAGITAQVRFTL